MPKSKLPRQVDENTKQIKEAVKDIRQINNIMRRFDGTIRRIERLLQLTGVTHGIGIIGTAEAETGLQITTSGLQITTSRISRQTELQRRMIMKLLKKQIKITQIPSSVWQGQVDVDYTEPEISYVTINDAKKLIEDKKGTVYLSRLLSLGKGRGMKRPSISMISNFLGPQAGTVAMYGMLLLPLILQIVNMAVALWEQKEAIRRERERQAEWNKTKTEISKQVRDQAKDSQSKFRSVVP